MPGEDPGEQLDAAMRKVRIAIQDLYPTSEDVSISELTALGTALLQNGVGFLANSRYQEVTGAKVSTAILQEITNRTNKFVFEIIDRAIQETHHTRTSEPRMRQNTSERNAKTRRQIQRL